MGITCSRVAMRFPRTLHFPIWEIELDLTQLEALGEEQYLASARNTRITTGPSQALRDYGVRKAIP